MTSIQKRGASGCPEQHRLTRRLAFVVLLAATPATTACSRAAHSPANIPPAPGTPRALYALRAIDLAEGTGAAAAPRKCIYAHYTGWLTDGTKFDSSRDTIPNGQPRTPIVFPQGSQAVIGGWDSGGFEGMRVGGQRRLFIPYQLAYGEAGRLPRIPARAELIFDVELMAVADTLARTDTVAARRRADFNPRCAPWDAVRGTPAAAR